MQNQIWGRSTAAASARLGRALARGPAKLEGRTPRAYASQRSRMGGKRGELYMYRVVFLGIPLAEFASRGTWATSSRAQVSISISSSCPSAKVSALFLPPPRHVLFLLHLHRLARV